MRALVLALLLALPVVSAHADPNETVYDPLTLDLPGWLAPAHAIARAPPAAGALPFAAITPGAQPTPLDFSASMPERFAPGGGLSVHVRLVATKPVVAQDANGQTLRVQLLAAGKLVPGAERTLATGQAVLAPGAVVDLLALVPLGSVSFASHETLTVLLTPLMPALADDALALAVGPEGSRADFPAAHLLGPEDLGIEEPRAARVFLLSSSTFDGAVPGAALFTYSVTQNATRAIATPATAPVTFVVLRGDHSIAEARAYHEQADPAARNDAAQVFRVGQTRVRVHPGLGVAVRLDLAPGQVVDVACESCATPFKATLPPLAATDGEGAQTYDPSNVLIPPPRDTSGIPVSGDGAPARKTPADGLAALVAAGVAVALLQRRR